MSGDNQKVDGPDDDFAEARLRQVLAKAVEDGLLKIIGFDRQGQPVYERTALAQPRRTP